MPLFLNWARGSYFKGWEKTLNLSYGLGLGVVSFRFWVQIPRP